MTKSKISSQKGKQSKKQQSEQENHKRENENNDENRVNSSINRNNNRQNGNSNQNHQRNQLHHNNNSNQRDFEESKEDRVLVDISRDCNIQSQNMYIDDPTTFFVGEIVDFENSSGRWVDAVVEMKNKGKLKVKTLSKNNPEEAWVDKFSARIVKQWNQNNFLNDFSVNQRLAILDREINENSKHITKENYLEARVIQSDAKLKEIQVTYTPKLNEDFDEWISCNSLRIQPISLISNCKQHTKYIQENLSNNPENKKQLKKKAKDYENEQVKEYKENILKKGLVLREMDMDGNCLFRSVADQLYGDASLHQQIRKSVVEYMQIEKQYFINFIAEMEENSKNSKKKKKNKQPQQKKPVEVQSTKENKDEMEEPKSQQDIAFENYVREMSENGTWGDDVEIQIISEIYHRSVEIYYAFEETPMRTFHESQNQFESVLPIRLSYHGKCHYNSIKSINSDRLIAKKIGEVEGEAIKNALKRQEALRAIADEKGEGFSNNLQDMCRSKFELIQNAWNTEELYQRLIQEQYESQAQLNNENEFSHPGEIMKKGLIYEAEQFNLMNGACNQDIALQLALEESKYMMENSEQNGNDEFAYNDEKQYSEGQGKANTEQNKDNNNNNIKQENEQNNQELTQQDMESIIAINAVLNAGFTREQAEQAIQVVGPNEDLIVNFILENMM